MSGVLGIDPGASGGIAIIDVEGARCYKMPETETDVCELLRELQPRIQMTFIEAVHSMPKQGVASSFKFGVNYGGLRMALIALKIPMQAVTPGVWQRAMGCLSGGDKNVTKRKAQELFPQLRITHKVADAVLIAEYGRRSLFKITP